MGTTPQIHTVEIHRPGEEWSVWTVAKSLDDAEKTTVTLRRCNPDRRARVAVYTRTATGPES